MSTGSTEAEVKLDDTGTVCCPNNKNNCSNFVTFIAEQSATPVEDPLLLPSIAQPPSVVLVETVTKDDDDKSVVPVKAVLLGSLPN